MVALEFLVLSVIVRIGVEQQAIQVQALESLHFFYSFSGFIFFNLCLRNFRNFYIIANK